MPTDRLLQPLNRTAWALPQSERRVIAFEKETALTRAPRLIARRVTLDLDLVGVGSVASVERSSIR